MLAIALALGASLCWGSGDFLGGLTTRRASLWAVVAGSQGVGLAGAALAVLVTGRAWPGLSAVWPVLLGGLAGRVAYALGFTGEGVAAVRFGANVCLDLLGGDHTERTALRQVGRNPIPWPPEPLRYAAIRLTQRSMQYTHDNDGREGAWLRTLGRFKLGFDT